MTDKRILCTERDGRVSIICPAAQCIRELHDGVPQGRERRDRQIAQRIRDGISEWIAVRWVDALINGGNTEAEALGLILDKDKPVGSTAHEALNYWELPTDRWFRNAWRRGHNGGPIWVDLGEAKTVQMAAIMTRTLGAEKHAASLGDLATWSRVSRIKDKWSVYDTKIKAAREVEDLRRIWPEELPA